VYITVVTQPYFQIVEEINYMFRPFTGLAIIRLKLEISEKTHTAMWSIPYIKNGGTRSRFTMFGEVRSYGSHNTTVFSNC
jgi:hypothetical protein